MFSRPKGERRKVMGMRFSSSKCDGEEDITPWKVLPVGSRVTVNGRAGVVISRWQECPMIKGCVGGGRQARNLDQENDT